MTQRESPMRLISQGVRGQSGRGQSGGLVWGLQLALSPADRIRSERVTHRDTLLAIAALRALKCAVFETLRTGRNIDRQHTRLASRAERADGQQFWIRLSHDRLLSGSASLSPWLPMRGTARSDYAAPVAQL